MEKINEEIDRIIQEAIKQYDGSYNSNNFETLISFGELVDRLSIVNFKLFTLKNKVAEQTDIYDNPEFGAWAALEDIKLVEERARLKRCIDEKLTAIIHKIISGDITGGYNQEIKKYGQ